MKKKILSLLLAAVMILLLIPVIAVPASATSSEIKIVSGSFVGYKTFLKAVDEKGDRYTQRGNLITLSKDHPIAHAFDGKTNTYAGGTGGVGGYYPSLYLNDAGELVKDKTYDNVNESVGITTYIAEHPNNYYGVFKFALESTAELETVTIYAEDDKGLPDSVKAFDVLYSADGMHWTLAQSYTDMRENTANWDSWDGSLATLNVPMAGVEAKFIMVAMSVRSGQLTSGLWVMEIAVTGNAVENSHAVYEVSNQNQLMEAMEAHNISKDPKDVIKMTSDIIITDNADWNNRLLSKDMAYIYGEFDGQGHTIYNLTCASFIWPYGDCWLGNFTVSNKTALDGETFKVSGAINIFGGKPVKSEVQAGKTVVVYNVVSERELDGSNNATGAFFGNIQIDSTATIKLINCVNTGNFAGQKSQNHKIGGFVGCLGTGTLIIENGLNTGNISASQAGGFVGVYSEGTTLTIKNCSNAGNITGIANGTGYGIAGGIVGGFNNGGSLGSDTTITITGCVNTGDIKVNYTADSSKDCTAGGIIGHAGGTEKESSVAYTVTIDNCAVYGCTIDAMGDDQTYGNTAEDPETGDKTKEYAGSFVGKVSPQGTGHSIVAKASYVNGVSVRAEHARKFIGVGSHNAEIQAQALNVVALDVNEMDAEGNITAWNSAKNSGCNVAAAFLENNGCKYTSNLISQGAKGMVQVSPSNDKVRFIATLGETTYTGGDFEKVGFLVTFKSDAGDVIGWNISGTTLYTSLNANGIETWTPTNGDAYVFALTITDIPADTNGQFQATPYIVAKDGSILFGSTGSFDLGSGL